MEVKSLLMHILQMLPGPDNHTSLHRYLQPQMKSYQRLNFERPGHGASDFATPAAQFFLSPLLLSLTYFRWYFFLQS